LDDRGAATIWTVGGIAVVMAVLAGVVVFAQAVVARHQVESAADLAALAAAGRAPAGEGPACAAAAGVAAHMHVGLSTCSLSGLDALVEVVLVPPGVLGQFGSAAARARAGPVERHR
jgi:secretion/DNA translocation related TadE-like protein